MTATKRILSAFLDLIAEKPFHNITVRNIVERAQVNRSTFYAHFMDIYDLRDQLITLACQKLNDSIPIAHFLSDQPDTEAIALSIQKIHQDHDFFCIILHPNMECNVESTFSGIIETHVKNWAAPFVGNYSTELFARLYAANCLATIHWSLQHPEINTHEVAKIIAGHIKRGFFHQYIDRDL